MGIVVISLFVCALCDFLCNCRSRNGDESLTRVRRRRGGNRMNVRRRGISGGEVRDGKSGMGSPEWKGCLDGSSGVEREVAGKSGI